MKIEMLTDVTAMLKNFPLIQQLNPSMTVRQYEDRLMAIVRQGGYFQIVCRDEAGALLGLTGIWLGTQLWCGKYLEVDNFIVDESVRHRGVGKFIMEWVERKALDEKCEMIRLDSYVAAEKAHRFYFARGFKVEGFHMTKRR